MQPAHKTVLFLCTGNYYRSRFAEILFNTLAEQQAIPWRADSRALNIEMGRLINPGPISQHAIRGLLPRKITLPVKLRYPLGLELEDLEKAALVIAIKEAEHRPLLKRNFPGWENRVEYWHVHDLDAADPTEALMELETLVRSLLERLKP